MDKIAGCPGSPADLTEYILQQKAVNVIIAAVWLATSYNHDTGLMFTFLTYMRSALLLGYRLSCGYESYITCVCVAWA